LNITNETPDFCDQFLRQLELGELANPVHVGRVANVVYFETAFSSARAWSIWSYAYVTMAGSSHCFTVAGERFVGLVAKDIA
jgi:hypothetical protein